MRRRSTYAQPSGFTLIELMVVIVIMGTLLAIAVPPYRSYRARAACNAAAQELRGNINRMHNQAILLEDYTYIQIVSSTMYQVVEGAANLSVTDANASTYTDRVNLDPQGLQLSGVSTTQILRFGPRGWVDATTATVNPGASFIPSTTVSGFTVYPIDVVAPGVRTFEVRTHIPGKCEVVPQ